MTGQFILTLTDLYLVLIQNKAICHQFGTSDSSSTIEELAPFETTFEKRQLLKKGLF